VKTQAVKLKPEKNQTNKTTNQAIDASLLSVKPLSLLWHICLGKTSKIQWIHFHDCWCRTNL